MKAQGLSVSFVVVAALAILVLVLGVAFLMGAFGSQKQTTQLQNIKSTCNSWCSDMQMKIQNVDCTTGTSTGDECVEKNAGTAYTNFCTKQFNIGGTTKTCKDITSCVVTDSLGNQITVDCSSQNTGNSGSQGGTGQ